MPHIGNIYSLLNCFLYAQLLWQLSYLKLQANNQYEKTWRDVWETKETNNVNMAEKN